MATFTVYKGDDIVLNYNIEDAPEGLSGYQAHWVMAEEKPPLTSYGAGDKVLQKDTGNHFGAGGGITIDTNQVKVSIPSGNTDQQSGIPIGHYKCQLILKAPNAAQRVASSDLLILEAPIKRINP